MEDVPVKKVFRWDRIWTIVKVLISLYVLYLIVWFIFVIGYTIGGADACELGGGDWNQCMENSMHAWFGPNPWK